MTPLRPKPLRGTMREHDAREARLRNAADEPGLPPGPYRFIIAVMSCI
jgi:hypothetical protein